MPAFRIKKFSHINQAGQGIIEIVVVLALAAILILALVALSVRSNRSANFSKAEDQAARLAQEGQEILQDIRSNKSDNVLDFSGTRVDWNWIFTQDFSGSEEVNLTETGCDPSELCLDPTLSGEVLNLSPDTRSFSRQVFIADDPDDPSTPAFEGPSQCNTYPATTDWQDIKQFVVKVTWTDGGGDHTIATSSCLRR